MEAGNPKRAAVRLVATLGGAVLTVGLLIATAYLAGERPAKPADQDQAAWELVETGESYRLPQSAEPVTPVATPPVAAEYQPPVYEAPRVAQKPPSAPATPPAKAQPPSTEWSGPVTIHNPAAYGPPEDDSLPPIPTATTGAPPEPPVLARIPDATVRAELQPQAGRPPVAWTPTETLPGLGSSEPLASGTPAGRSMVPTKVRPLRDLGPSQGAALLSYTASTNDLSKRLASEVQAGFQLGKSGAVYAARGKFVGVLRRIALAKDAESGSNDHARALAEGLRTLDDADDFVPRGDALEAELDVAAIASSHGLRLLGEAASPHEAIARYSQHAAQQLALAAAGEPAGSMALYGLGKAYARLEAQGDDPTAGRKGTVMYRAAVDSNADNFLAANELGVRLARNGRYQQASEVLRQAAARPTAIATVHANLAAVEERLGNRETARLAQQHSERLAQDERATGQVSRRHGIEWVAPEQFRRGVPQQVAAAPVAQPAPVAPSTVAQPAQGGWSGFLAKAKRATGWSSPQPPATAGTPGSYASPPVMASQPRVVR